MEEILRLALKKADAADVFYSESDGVLARNSLDRVEACKSSRESGYGLRVVHKGRTGFAYFTRVEDAKRAVDEAVRTAKLLPKENLALPSPSRPKPVKSFDRRVTKVDEDSAVDMLLAMVNGASEKALPVKGEVSAGTSTHRIINSEGVDLESKETTFFAYEEAKKGKSLSYDEHSSSRITSTQPIGFKAGEWASLGNGAKPVAFKGRICLSVEALSSFFASAVLEQFNGESARRKKTTWANSLNKRVMHPRINVVEDPHIPWAQPTAAFDDEGRPTRKKSLIRNGVLKKFLYDSRTAALSKAKPTGSGFRPSYSVAPETSVTNIVLNPSEKCNAFANSGLFVRELMGFHNMNSVTGDFALTITLGFTLKNGEFDKPVRGSILRGNIFSALKDNPMFDKKALTRDWFTSPRMCFDAEVVK